MTDPAYEREVALLRERYSREFAEEIAAIVASAPVPSAEQMAFIRRVVQARRRTSAADGQVVDRHDTVDADDASD